MSRKTKNQEGHYHLIKMGPKLEKVKPSMNKKGTSDITIRPLTWGSSHGHGILTMTRSTNQGFDLRRKL